MTNGALDLPCNPSSCRLLDLHHPAFKADVVSSIGQFRRRLCDVCPYIFQNLEIGKGYLYSSDRAWNLQVHALQDTFEQDRFANGTRTQSNLPQFDSLLKSPCNLRSELHWTGMGKPFIEFRRSVILEMTVNKCSHNVDHFDVIWITSKV